jgi:hypothetical protein
VKKRFNDFLTPPPLAVECHYAGVEGAEPTSRLFVGGRGFEMLMALSRSWILLAVVQDVHRHTFKYPCITMLIASQIGSKIVHFGPCGKVCGYPFN